MTIAQEEIFGPVVAVILQFGQDEAVAIANDSPYGLSGSVWRGDAEQVGEGGAATAHRQRGRQPVHARHRRAVRRLQALGLGREYGLGVNDEYVELQQASRRGPQPAASLRRRTSASSV